MVTRVVADQSGGTYRALWRLSTDVPVTSYSIRIAGSDGKPVFSRIGLISTSVPFPAPSAGQYRAVVSVELADGTNTSSAPYTFTVEGSGGKVFGILALLAAAGLVGWFLMRRANERGAKKRKKDEEDA
jgi:hypothetical protein